MTQRRKNNIKMYSFITAIGNTYRYKCNENWRWYSAWLVRRRCIKRKAAYKQNYRKIYYILFVSSIILCIHLLIVIFISTLMMIITVNSEIRFARKDHKNTVAPSLSNRLSFVSLYYVYYTIWSVNKDEESGKRINFIALGNTCILLFEKYKNYVCYVTWDLSIISHHISYWLSQR